jgi:hypothetical protein
MAARYGDQVNEFLNEFNDVQDVAIVLDEDDLRELDEANGGVINANP